MDLPEYYVFTLYVDKLKAPSRKSYERLVQLCQECLPGRHVINVVDLSQRPDEAIKNNIVASPTLVAKLPQAVMTFVGDLSNDAAIRLAIEKAK